MARRAGKELLTREAWMRTALQAMATSGVGAVSVDRLARELGATRGSFYWHFKDKADLIAASLELWERENTIEFMPELQNEPDPEARLRGLFRAVYEGEVDVVEISLASAADDPVLGAAAARVAERRVELLRRIFSDLGFGRAEAKSRAWLAYGFYVGHHQLGRNSALAELRPKRLHQVVDLLLAGDA